MALCYAVRILLCRGLRYVNCEYRHEYSLFEILLTDKTQLYLFYCVYDKWGVLWFILWLMSRKMSIQQISFLDIGRKRLNYSTTGSHLNLSICQIGMYRVIATVIQHLYFVYTSVDNGWFKSNNFLVNDHFVPFCGVKKMTGIVAGPGF